MKFRDGFVSNSSSASFVISKECFSTIWDVAIAMIALRHWECDEEDLDTVFWRKRKGDECKALTFPTRNFDTFILDNNDEWWISTCNNHTHFFYLFKDHEVEIDPAITVQRYDRTHDGRMYREDYGVKDYIEFCMEKDHEWETL